MQGGNNSALQSSLCWWVRGTVPPGEWSALQHPFVQSVALGTGKWLRTESAFSIRRLTHFPPESEVSSDLVLFPVWS